MFKRFYEEHSYQDTSIEEIRLKLFVHENRLDVALANDLLEFYSVNQIKELIIIPDFYYRIEEFVNPSYSSSVLGLIRDLVYYDYDPNHMNVHNLTENEVILLRKKLKINNIFDLFVDNEEDTHVERTNVDTDSTNVDDLEFEEFDNLIDFLDGGWNNIDLEDVLNEQYEDESVSEEEYYFRESEFKYIDFLYKYVLKDAVLIDAKDEKAIFDKIHDKNYYLRFLNGNLRLVVYMAFRYSFYYGHMTQDLIQAGFIGLMNAMKLFDSSLGFKFSTFAVNHIRQQIVRFIHNYQSLIRIPVHRRERLSKISNLKYQYRITNSVGPTIRYLSQEFNITISEMEEEIRLLNLSSNFSELTEDQLVKLHHSYCYDPTSEYIYIMTLRENIERILSDSLTSRECFVIKERFGLTLEGKGKTLKEIGIKIGVTRERVRQIEATAHRKLIRNRTMRQLFDIMKAKQSGDEDWKKGLSLY